MHCYLYEYCIKLLDSTKYPIQNEEAKPLETFLSGEGGGGGGNSHIKKSGMLIVPLRVQNLGFWCQTSDSNILMVRSGTA